MQHKRISYFFIILLTGIIAASCASSEKVTVSEGPLEQFLFSSEDEARSQLQMLLASSRSRLSDVFHTQRNDMPETFLKTDTTSQPQRDPFDGFRIQIISTPNKPLADSLARQFRLWADTTITGYSPETHMFFKQPFYKVHVGDFHNRDRAYELSRLVKQKYPAAWVVHDRIDPDLVPADTTHISLVKEE